MSSSAWDVVRMTTGMTRSCGSSLSSASTSWPERRGRLRSSRIRSGRGAPVYSPVWRRNCSACSPSVTTCSLFWILWCWNASLVIRMSPGSSSTSSTSTIWYPVHSGIGILIGWQHGQGKAEPGAGGALGIQPYLASVILDDLLDHGQADAGAGVGRPVVQPLEDNKDPVGVLGLDPNAVVAEREEPVRALPAGRHRNPGRRIPAELQRVAEQVLEHRGEQRDLAQHDRQLALFYGRVRLPDLGGEIRPCLG